MSKTFATITPEVAELIGRQHLFFVATAPSGADGHVNLSPKGLDTFSVLDEQTVAWVDLTGSGVETVAHLRDNGRITIMFCAFEGPPNIIRLYGRGVAHAIDSPRARELLDRFADHPGARTVVTVAVDRVSTSCGYGVPRMTFDEDRSRLVEWAERRGPAGIAEYWAENNVESIDGLAGMIDDG
ncbi:MAG TPA: pyridoxamine 5'-phosphate oxidase family protein [Acidimicrobiia bacterium]|nr:pyridoxamine 5'-phosphate oxidase family protein [Acidimicrobiia bacterium]